MGPQGCRSSARVRCAGALIAFAALGSLRCADAPTRIVVVLEVDPAVAPRIEAVDLTMRREGTASEVDAGHYPLERFSLLPPGPDGLVVLQPRDPSDARRLFLSVRGSLEGDTAIRQTAVVRFVRGQTLYLHMVLTASCVSVACTDGATCLDGVCSPLIERALPSSPPSPTPRDAAAPFDAPGQLDATNDGPADAPQELRDGLGEVLGDRSEPSDATASGDADALDDAADEVPLLDAARDAVEQSETFDDAGGADLPTEPGADAFADAADTSDIGPSVMDIPVMDVAAEAGGDATGDGGADATEVSVDGNDATVDAPPIERCTPGLMLAGNAPSPLTPWSASNVGSATPTLRWRLRPGVPLLPVCIEICRDRSCTTVEQVIRHPGGGPSGSVGALVPRPLDAGVHFWRITAQDPAFSPPQWSPFSATWEFFVARNAPVRPVGESPVWGCVPDFNGDGLADAIVPTSEARQGIQVYLSARAEGIRGVTPLVVADVNALRLSVGDVNGDGFVDLVTVGYASPEVSWARGGPSGLSSAMSVLGGYVSEAACAPGASCDCRAIGDVDDDGAADVFCTPFDIRLSGRLVSKQRVVFGPDPFGEADSSRLLDGFADTGVTAAAFAGFLDADRDGIVDLLITPHRLPRQIDLIRGEAAWPGRVYHSFNATLGAARLTTGGDLNGDGHADLVSDGVGTDVGGEVLFGPLHLGRPRSLPFAASNHGQLFPSPIESPVDVDGDGLTDLLRSNSSYSGVARNGGRVLVLLGQRDGVDGTLSMRTVPPTFALTWCRSIAEFRLGWTLIPLGDTNGDGLGDFLAGAAGGPEMLFYRGVLDVERDLEPPHTFRWPLRL